MVRRLLGLVLPLVGSATAVWLSTIFFDRDFFSHAISLTTTTTGETVRTVVIVAVIFGLVNLTVKPVARFITWGIRVLTLGLFSLVINGAMLLLTGLIAWWFDLPFHVSATWWVIVVAIFIGFVSGVLNTIGDFVTKERPKAPAPPAPPQLRGPQQYQQYPQQQPQPRPYRG